MDLFADPAQANATLMNKIGTALTTGVRCVRRFLLPLHSAASMASGIFEFWSILRRRRTSLGNWKLFSSEIAGEGRLSGSPNSLDPFLLWHWEVAARNFDSANGRFFRDEWHRFHSGDDASASKGESPLHVPPDDDDHPPPPAGKRPPHALRGDLDSASDSDGHSGDRPRANWSTQVNRPSGNLPQPDDSSSSGSHIAERLGDGSPLDFQPTQRRRTDSHAEQDKADEGFARRCQLPVGGTPTSGRLTTTSDLERAFRYPLEGRPQYQFMFLFVKKTLRNENHVFSSPFDQFPDNHVFVREVNDPATGAKQFFGSVRVVTRDFRMLNGARELRTPLVNSKYEVWPLSERLVREAQHHWRMGIRLGPNASREGAYSVMSLDATPRLADKPGSVKFRRCSPCRDRSATRHP